jgi:single-strand DNA-binding protein
VAFGKLAETCNSYLKKGRQVFVEGRLRTREFEPKKNGGKRERTEIVASKVQFLGKPIAIEPQGSIVEDMRPAEEDLPF